MGLHLVAAAAAVAGIVGVGAVAAGIVGVAAAAAVVAGMVDACCSLQDGCRTHSGLPQSLLSQWEH